MHASRKRKLWRFIRLLKKENASLYHSRLLMHNRPLKWNASYALGEGVQPATRFYLLVALIHRRNYFGTYQPPPPPQPRIQIDTLAWITLMIWFWVGAILPLNGPIKRIHVIYTSYTAKSTPTRPIRGNVLFSLFRTVRHGCFFRMMLVLVWLCYEWWVWLYACFILMFQISHNKVVSLEWTRNCIIMN